MAQRLRLWLRGRWLGFKRWLFVQLNKLRTARRLHEIPALLEPSALALYKVYRACPWIPPDTVSAGLQNGGDALFFRHDDGIEIFIGRNFDHAADELIAWLKLQGDEVSTRTRTTMNRHTRRAYAKHFRGKR